ncbi:hypothetical protein J4438_03060 [Candidatus Woesearchaeota archaeon]|nr:hypothetical protein [Candidatus Woesearchaeota archaeon]
MPFFCWYFSRPDNFGERPNFNLDDTVKNDTIYFFDSTSNIDEIRNYCEENRPNCGFYCMEINPNHEICSQMQKPGVQPK